MMGDEKTQNGLEKVSGQVNELEKTLSTATSIIQKMVERMVNFEERLVVVEKQSALPIVKCDPKVLALVGASRTGDSLED
jgi:hypothetical protein